MTRTPKEHELVEYVSHDGGVHKGIVIHVGDRAGLVETIWFEHPDGTPGKVKHVHWVPHESPECRTACWRERSPA